MQEGKIQLYINWEPVVFFNTESVHGQNNQEAWLSTSRKSNYVLYKDLHKDKLIFFNYMAN
eukprot:GAHX01002235.1.p2 GENE.GAHX01002235.1~~GAHX01002235.1.p2  ORF type:complete len:61 (+),score=7.96 GAHX01002235.1:925-1107(+)